MGIKKMRVKSAKRTYKEIASLISEYNIELITFIDDDFIGSTLYDREKVKEICTDIKKLFIQLWADENTIL